MDRLLRHTPRTHAMPTRTRLGTSYIGQDEGWGVPPRREECCVWCVWIVFVSPYWPFGRTFSASPNETLANNHSIALASVI